MNLKYKFLKAVDIAGLNFLRPVILLCYKEEPEVKMKKIGQQILIPLLAIAVFLGVWYVMSEEIQTKAGKLPNPSETLGAASSINVFAKRENMKESAYAMTGKSLREKIEHTESRLEKISEQLEDANSKVTRLKEKHQESILSQTAPLYKVYDELKAKNKEAEEKRETEIEEKAENLQEGDKEAYQELLVLYRTSDIKEEEEKAALQLVKDRISEVEGQKSKAAADALAAQTYLAEEQLYLKKLLEHLGDDNRMNKIAAEKEKIAEYKAALQAQTGKDALRTAKKIIRSEEKIERLESSEYAKPATLYYQVRRSLLCVFTGFLIGSIIAIPIGILCGLAKTFMAAMTPFIAIFKPVSPIVWLPIALIIVGGFIQDPESNGFILWLWDLPLLGEYKINPAFIASAITVAVCSLWPTLVNTALGVASIDKDHINVARVLRLNFTSRLFKIVIPSALPLMFTGLRISLGVGWMVLIAAELLSSSEGIGKFVWDQFNNGASDSFAKMVVVVFVVGIIGLFLDRIMIVFQRLVSFEEISAAI